LINLFNRASSTVAAPKQENQTARSRLILPIVTPDPEAQPRHCQGMLGNVADCYQALRTIAKTKE
jgi:hypothetical protein